MEYTGYWGGGLWGGNQVGDLLVEFGGFLVGGLDGEAWGEAGAEVADVREPSVVEDLGFGDEEFFEFGVEVFCRGDVPGFQDGGGNDAVAFIIEMDAIGGEGVGRVGFALFECVLFEGGVEVDEYFDLVFLGEEPGGVFIEDVIVVFIDVFVAVFFFAEGFEEVFRAEGEGVEGRRSHEDEFCPGGMDLVDEFFGSGLVGLEAFFTEGVVDAVVHAVAGDYDVGFGFGEGAVESFVDVRSGEGVIGFGESGAGFAGEACVDEFGDGRDAVGAEVGFDVGDEASGVGIGIAEEEDAFGVEGEGMIFGV